MCTKKNWKRRFLKSKGANPLKGCKPNWTAFVGFKKGHIPRSVKRSEKHAQISNNGKEGLLAGLGKRGVEHPNKRRRCQHQGCQKIHLSSDCPLPD